MLKQFSWRDLIKNNISVISINQGERYIICKKEHAELERSRHKDAKIMSDTTNHLGMIFDTDKGILFMHKPNQFKLISNALRVSNIVK